MKIFRAPPLISDALSYIGKWFSQRTERSISPPVIVVPDKDPEPSYNLPVSDRLRHWRACDEQPSEALIRAITRGFDALRLFKPQDVKEVDTGSFLIAPVLEALGYWPYLQQCAKNGNIPDYSLSDQVALEIKKNSSLYDQLSGPNQTKRFSTIAHQIVTYLDELDFTTMLYSNGSFWWRIERDDDLNELHALRFNMRLAFSEIRNQQRTVNLGRFSPLFHVSAFRPGNNYSIEIRQGLGQRIEPFDKVGLVWTKDINNGFSNRGF